MKEIEISEIVHGLFLVFLRVVASPFIAIGSCVAQPRSRSRSLRPRSP